MIVEFLKDLVCILAAMLIMWGFGWAVVQNYRRKKCKSHNYEPIPGTPNFRCAKCGKVDNRK